MMLRRAGEDSQHGGLDAMQVVLGLVQHDRCR
jgi:hypothetical protein